MEFTFTFLSRFIIVTLEIRDHSMSSCHQLGIDYHLNVYTIIIAIIEVVLVKFVSLENVCSIENALYSESMSCVLLLSNPYCYYI